MRVVPAQVGGRALTGDVGVARAAAERHRVPGAWDRWAVLRSNHRTSPNPGHGASVKMVYDLIVIT